jgi:hypothetical protein
MLQMDGSTHVWLRLRPELRPTLLQIVDDATSRLLYAQFEQGETTMGVLRALQLVVNREGVPASLYTDRAAWAFETPVAGRGVDKTHLTSVGQVLKRLVKWTPFFRQGVKVDSQTGKESRNGSSESSSFQGVVQG